MSRTLLNAILTERALHHVVGSANSPLVDNLLEAAEGTQLKNVCAKVSSELSDKIDSICDLLDISKRRFLEAAMIEAVEQASAIIKEEGVIEALAQHSSGGGE